MPGLLLQTLSHTGQGSFQVGCLVLAMRVTSAGFCITRGSTDTGTARTHPANRQRTLTAPLHTVQNPHASALPRGGLVTAHVWLTHVRAQHLIRGLLTEAVSIADLWIVQASSPTPSQNENSAVGHVSSSRGRRDQTSFPGISGRNLQPRGPAPSARAADPLKPADCIHSARSNSSHLLF